MQKAGVKRALVVVAAVVLIAALLFAAVLSAEGGEAEAAALKRGSTGDKVSEMQRKLKNWGYYDGSVDGIFGSGTESAVKFFQRKNGLSADGIVGSATAAALGMTLSGASSSQTGGVSSGVLKRGSTGDKVSEMQRKLKDWGYYDGSVDGIFGSGTESAVKFFQRKNGLSADGIGRHSGFRHGGGARDDPFGVVIVGRRERDLVRS